MSIEIEPVRGPLDEAGLRSIADLYGVVDAKYASLDFIRHQFVGNPFGWSAHVFVLDDGRAVGHCCAVPFRARRGAEELIAGKIEAVVVDSEHRGRRTDGRSLATEMLSALYPFGLDCGMNVLFGLAPPHVARVHVRAGCHEVAPHAPAYTSIASWSAFARSDANRERLATARALSLAQSAAGAMARTIVRDRQAIIEPPRESDTRLASAEISESAWTVSGSDAWDWFVGSGTLESLELPDSRALIRIGAHGASPAQIVAWEPHRSGVVPAVRLLGAVARLARERNAPTLRFQPWPGAAGDGALARACSLLGFVRRPEAALVLYARDPAMDAFQLTPFFYVTF